MDKGIVKLEIETTFLKGPLQYSLQQVLIVSWTTLFFKQKLLPIHEDIL